MRRRPLRVPRVADIPHNRSFRDDIAGPNAGETLQMRVIVPVAARSQDSHDATTQHTVSNSDDDAGRCAGDLSAPRSKDVDALVAPASGTRRTPGVSKVGAPDAANGYGQSGRSIASDESKRDDGMANQRIASRANVDDDHKCESDQKNDCAPALSQVDFLDCAFNCDREPRHGRSICGEP